MATKTIRAEEQQHSILDYFVKLPDPRRNKEIDGKTLRRSHQRGRGKGPLHLVSAWAANNGLTLGQVKVDDKSNEITAVPKLLKLLYLKGCIVTIDAMGTQKEIARQIREKEADYVPALKDNQPTLYAEVEGIFIAEEDSLRREKKSKSQESGSTFYETVEQGHGRRETRRVMSVAAPEWLGKKETWQDLRSLVMVEAKREVNGQTSTERRYFISSLASDAQRAAEIVRSH